MCIGGACVVPINLLISISKSKQSLSISSFAPQRLSRRSLNVLPLNATGRSPLLSRMIIRHISLVIIVGHPFDLLRNLHSSLINNNARMEDAYLMEFPVFFLAFFATIMNNTASSTFSKNHFLNFLKVYFKILKVKLPGQKTYIFG